jgi:hypothetical protein
MKPAPTLWNREARIVDLLQITDGKDGNVGFVQSPVWYRTTDSTEFDGLRSQVELKKVVTLS